MRSDDTATVLVGQMRPRAGSPVRTMFEPDRDSRATVATGTLGPYPEK